MHILILHNRLSRLGDWKREYDLGTSNTSALLLLGQRLDPGCGQIRDVVVVHVTRILIKQDQRQHDGL